MTECKGCGGEEMWRDYSRGQDDWCLLCQIVTPHLGGGQMPWMIRSIEEGEALRRKLGSPDCRPARVWRAIRLLESDAADWAFNDGSRGSDGDDEGRHPVWEIDDVDVELMDSGEIQGAEPSRLRKLQRGGVLPDGSHLSWADGSFYLDGHPCRIPYRGLRKLMNRKRGLEEVDWKSLLLSVDAICRQIPIPWKVQEVLDNGHTWLHPVEAMRYHGEHIDRRPDGFAAAMGMRRYWRWARSNWANGLTEEKFIDTEWMRRWRSMRDDTTVREEQGRNGKLVPSTLSIKRGRLQLRVRRPGGWRKLELDSNPLVWAKIVTWALSPTRHEDHRMLMGIQQWLFTDTDVQLLSQEDRKGMEGLRTNIEVNEDIRLNPGAYAIEVTGDSGAMYRVRPGSGAHGSRMVVFGLGHSSGERGQGGPRGRYGGPRPPLCIVESPQLRRLCLPDALGSTIMALKNDLVSQRYIDTVAQYIREVTPSNRDPRNAAVDVVRNAQELRNRLRNNQAEAAVRRYTEAFPRLWSVLLRRPLGYRLTLTARDVGVPNMRFEGCDAEFTTRGVVERRAVYGMLEASGWVRDHEEERERGLLRVYIRLGTGEQNLAAQVEEFAEIIEHLAHLNDRVRLIANPLWTYFERVNPGIGELLPGHDQRID